MLVTEMGRGGMQVLTGVGVFVEGEWPAFQGEIPSEAP